MPTTTTAAAQPLSKYALKKASQRFRAAYPDQQRMNNVLASYPASERDRIILHATLVGKEDGNGN